MKKIPLLKSGWFYLWTVLSISVLWADHLELFSPINAFALEIWGQTKNTPLSESKIIRLVSPQKVSSNPDILFRLNQQFPLATIAVGSDLNRKQIDSLINNPKLASEKLVILSKNSSSLPSITVKESKLPSLILHPNNINWMTSNKIHIAYQKQSQSNAFQLVWKNDDKYYPSFLADVLLSTQAPMELNFLQSALVPNRILLGANTFNVGWQGEIYPFEDFLETTDLSQLEHQINASYTGVIFLDDGSYPQAYSLARAISSLLHKNYFVSTILSLLTEVLLLLMLAAMVFKVSYKSVQRRIVFLSLFLTVSFLIQGAFVNFSIWMPTHIILLVSAVSLLIHLGFHFEESQIRNTNDQFNSLLRETTQYFYKHQKMEILLNHLRSTRPNQELLESISEIAIQSEATQNFSLAKTLHQWIVSHESNNKLSSERLNKLTEAEESEESLDQTMVIDANGEITKPNSTSILAIKSFGRYQVEGILGKGAMGIVFQGVDPKINRYVAIKTLQLNDDLDGDSLTETKQRFFREAETAGNLSHANIVTIYDVGEQQQENSNHSLGYIAMDLLTGAPLSEFVTPEKLLPPSLVYQLMIQLTDALDYAHRHKVIHRDIKPANIIYDDETQKGTLTDFGIAYMSDHSKTKTGTIMGSPFYMSPEQVIGKTVDGRSDIFSLGVTFYQLLSGHLPFKGESIASVAFHITKTKQESVRSYNKKLAASAARLTNKAMQKDPAKRYQTMYEFKQALINSLKRDYKKSPIS